MALLEKKRLLVRRMNSEMRAIASSPNTEVEKLRLALLTVFGEELKALNDQIAWRSCHMERVS